MQQHTVLITGANRGLGYEFAKQYLKEGWQVCACYRNPETKQDLQRLADENPNINLYRLDTCDQASIDQLANELSNVSIDLVINNAGVYGDTGVTLGNLSVSNLQTVFTTNAIAPLKVFEAFLDHVANSQLKSIVAISSKMGSITDNQYGRGYAYRASKVALNMMMKSLSIDTKERGIKVLSLHPGWVRTQMGGSEAPISAAESVTGMRAIIEKLTPEQSGEFYSYNGEMIPW